MSFKEEQENPLRVALYIRVSTDDQAEKYGPAMQKDALLNLIKSRGKLINGNDALVLAGEKYIYSDDISGKTPIEQRPEFSRLKEDILNAPKTSKPFDVVAVFKIDRFARKLSVLLDIIDFFNREDITFISVHESIDTATPFGRAILSIIGVIAELELENILIRTKAGREAAVREGKVMGPLTPYGFIKNAEGRLERFDPEADIVIRIFDLFTNEQKSVQDVASLLTGENVLSPSASAVFHEKIKPEWVSRKTPNNFWRAEQIRDFLMDERYIGHYYTNRYASKGILLPRKEWKLSERPLPLIIDPLTFEKAQKMLELRKHSRQTTHSGHKYLLSGLLQCDACKDEMGDRTHWVGNRKQLDDRTERFTYYYGCGSKNKFKSIKHCETLPLPGEEIEKFILDECIRIVSNPSGIYEYRQKLASSQNEIKHLQKRQQDFLRSLQGIPHQRELVRQQHEAEIIDITELKAKYAAFDEREKKLKKELDDIEEKLSQKTISTKYEKAVDVVAKRYGDSLGEVRKDRQKAFDLIHLLVDSIIIHSRPVEESDKIAGKKKPGQLIPNELEVKLKLPQEFLKETLVARGSHQNPLNRAVGRI